MPSSIPPAVKGSAIARALSDCGIDSATVVPDFVQIATHQYLDADRGRIDVTYCANENQALHVASGLYIGGRQPVIMMQNQGLYNCVNSLRACGLDARIPLLLMIGQFGREFSNFGQEMRASRRHMVSLLEPVLDALTIAHWNIETEADLGVVETAWTHAKRSHTPAAVIVGRHTEWD
ncbi:thiamine pyrophosphate enzyme, N-terminal TPP-binding domain protein [Achromobacter xylosoxidans A8]|uniref:Thiamine pyrophosphate enzyme, N-terminal TPP-binding domain protein n=1 Tax=Achromobacter xylosoxidans (strain A8) TaxID=762376 RepID=E3HVX8_ACHXA|nr:thiamine pyrophosphate-binding protein [Achromobacter xylosoxidans]ADP16291.1 thiamine pyrophosphate enzyme, N-terminal TPP-binding domain protein [Achromobacter xylosoxidans A8]